MTNRSTEEDAELAFLRDWCLAMIEYIGRGGDPRSTASQKKRILKAYKERRLDGFDGLRQAYDDYTGALKHIPPAERAPLDRLLHARFGRGFEEVDREDEEAVQRVLKRGKISTTKEAMLLMARTDELNRSATKKGEVAAIYRLLAEFRARFAPFRDGAKRTKPGARPPREDTEELVFLRDWCFAVAQFVGGAGFAAALQQEEGVIREAYDNGNLKGLRQAARDQAEMLRHLPKEDKRRLDALLCSKFGRGLDDMARDDAKAIARILTRGRIESEDEGRLLLARADEIYADESKRAELEAINRLLGNYEGGGASQ